MGQTSICVCVCLPQGRYTDIWFSEYSVLTMFQSILLHSLIAQLQEINSCHLTAQHLLGGDTLGTQSTQNATTGKSLLKAITEK